MPGSAPTACAGSSQGGPRDRRGAVTRRSAAGKAVQAADALDAWLTGHSGAGPEPAENSPAPGVDPGGPATTAAPRAAASPGTRPVPDHTDWLLHRLAVDGPKAELAALREAASGAGLVPWELDLDVLEEDWLHRLLAPAGRTLSLSGARVLAGQLRDAVERRHALAHARVGRSRACAFDLHALLPVPPDVLRLGPDHPDAIGWLWRHWGTTTALRHVFEDQAAAERAGLPLDNGQAAWCLTFWAADWTPWAAFATLRRAWPALRFVVRPIYDPV